MLKSSYIIPSDVKSPKASWHLFAVILDRGEGDCAYALGEWEGERRIGFRWNGSKDRPIGNPQSRGLPTWTVLDTDPDITEAVIELCAAEMKVLAKGFFGLK